MAFRESAPPPEELALHEKQPDAGSVHFQVVDSLSGAVLKSVRVAFQNEERFGEYLGRGDAQVLLSAGSYEAAFFAEGLEPLLLPEVEILGGALTDLGTLCLGAGCGVIEGEVLAPSLGADQQILVELFGHGRRPCPACPGSPERPCACGYSKEKSTKLLEATRHFTFEGLAAGTYFVRAERRCGYGEVCEVALESQGRAWVSIPLGRELAVPFQLVRASGAPYFAQADREAPLRVETFHEGVRRLCFRFWRGKELAALVEEAVYLHVDADMIIEEEQGEGGESEEYWEDTGEPRPIDRERQPGDALLPPTSHPGHGNAVWLAAKGFDANHWTLSPLPALELTFEVHTQNTLQIDSSGRLPLDLSNWSGEAIQVLMKPHR
jgi:hypothetical protein